MLLIDTSYFEVELILPGLNRPEITEVVEKLIEKYETKLLKEILGYGLYKEFTAGLAAPIVLSKWTDLKNGAEYKPYGRTYEWEGLLNPSKKLSLIANYVYYWIRRNHITQSTVVGEVITKTENSVKTSPDTKMIRAWNEMSASVRNMSEYLYYNTDFPTWSHTSYNYVTSEYYPINQFNL